MKFGDFALGFAKGATEQFEIGRTKTQKMVDAGIVRATSRGTELFKENEARTQELKERDRYLERNVSGLTPQQRAAFVGLPDSEWADVRAMFKQYIETGTEIPYSELFTAATAGTIGEVDSPESIQATAAVGNLLATPGLRDTIPTNQEEDVTNSFRRSLMGMGVIRPDEDFIQQRIRKGTIALMPELKTEEQYNRLFAQQEEAVTGPSLVDLGYNPQSLPLSVLDKARAEQLLKGAPAGTVYSPTAMGTNKRRLIGDAAGYAFGAGMDANFNILIADEEVNEAVTSNIANNIGSRINEVVMPLNQIPTGSTQDDQLQVIEATVTNVQPLITALEVNAHMKRLGLDNKAFNTNAITKENILALDIKGMTDEKATELAVEAGEARFGKDTRDGAILTLAMLENTGRRTGEGVPGVTAAGESVLTPAYSQINPHPNVVRTLTEFYRAIIAEEINANITSRDIVRVFNSADQRFRFDSTDPFASIGDFYKMLEQQARANVTNIDELD